MRMYQHYRGRLQHAELHGVRSVILRLSFRLEYWLATIPATQFLR